MDMEGKGFHSNVKTSIRLFELSDLDSVYNIEKRSFSYPWSETEFRYSHWKNPNGFFVAIRNKKVVGYIIVEIVNHLEPKKSKVVKLGHILNICVDTNFRNEGVGSYLIEATTLYLKSEGAEKILLEVRALNLDARTFYQNRGFREKQRKPRYYLNEDAILMVKEVKTRE